MCNHSKEHLELIGWFSCFDEAKSSKNDHRALFYCNKCKDIGRVTYAYTSPHIFWSRSAKHALHTNSNEEVIFFPAL